MSGDEEVAYVFLLRFLGVVQVIQKHPQYKQKRTEFDKLMSVENMTEAMDKAEKLAESLSQRLVCTYMYSGKHLICHNWI